ncbi:hypothetical protein PRNP1_012508 [Phytophthora ramorum]
MTPIVTGTSAQEPIISDATQDPQGSYIAGSQLLLLWDQRGDVDRAIELLGGVQQCPEGVNARVDSEFLEDALLTSCRQDAAGYDVTELFQPSEQVVTLSREQTTRLCRSEACAAWLSQAAEAAWLPECRYGQSQTSVRSLAETLLRVREDLVASSVDAAVAAPNASLFREFYQLNQLANLLNAKDDVSKAVETPVMQVSRHLEAQDNFSLMGSGESPALSAAVEPPGSTSGIGSASSIGSTSSSSTGSSSGSSSDSFSGSGSSSDSNSVGHFFPEGSYNSSDTVGFTGGSGLGPHGSSTATTTELTPSYAYVVGAWVLFNGSYFFLMRRK